MKILFSPEYRGHVFLGIDEENTHAMDVMVCDTMALIGMLELRLGIHEEDHAGHYRTVKYFEAMSGYMKKYPKNILSESFKLSSLGTAEEALRWRDSLVLDHWNGEEVTGMDRLNVLADIEKKFDCPGMPDRLKNILLNINKEKADRFKEIEVELPCPKELLHPAVQEVLEAMQKHGANLTFKANKESKAATNLQKVVAMLQSTSGEEIVLDEKDQSLKIYQFYDENAANEWLALKGDEMQADVWINDNNKTLDNWLRMMGKPTMGSTMEASIPQLLQLFVSGIDMMKEPLNIQSLTSWLQSPMQPMGTFFGGILADTVIGTGGYRNEECQKLIDQYIMGKYSYHDKEKEAKLTPEQIAQRDKRGREERKQLVKTYLPPMEASEQEGVETNRLKQYLDSLASWAKQRAFLLQDTSNNEGWCSQLESLAKMCETFVLLLDSSDMGEQVDWKQVESWISTLYKGEAFMQYTAQVGSRMLIDHPAKMATSSQRTIWMNFAGGDKRQLDCSFLYPTERKAVKDLLTLWDEASETAYNERMQLMPFVMTDKQLILVTTKLTGGEVTPEHPALIRIKKQVKNWQAFVEQPNLLGEEMEEVVPAIKVLETNMLTFDHADRLKWPDHLSPTALDTLVEYPLDYLMERQLKIVSTVPNSIAELKRTKGTVAHAVIEHLFAPRDDKRCSTADEIAKRIAEEFDDQVRKQIEACGAILYLPENKLEASLLKEQLKRCLDVLLEILRDNKLVVTGCEREIRKDMQLLKNDKGWDMLGVIDMTLEDENHHPVVFDFKWASGRGTSPKNYYRKLLEDNRSIQLEMYRYLLSAETRDTVKRTGYFLMPEAHLYSKERFEGIHCTPLPSENKDNIVEQLRQSFFYRKEQMDQGRVEIGEGCLVDSLAYTQALEARNLFALKSDDKGKQEENRFSNYTLFKTRKENEV